MTILNHLFQKVESENIQITEKRFKPQYVFVIVQLDAMPLIKNESFITFLVYRMPKKKLSLYLDKVFFHIRKNLVKFKLTP